VLATLWVAGRDAAGRLAHERTTALFAESAQNNLRSELAECERDLAEAVAEDETRRALAAAIESQTERWQMSATPTPAAGHERERALRDLAEAAQLIETGFSRMDTVPARLYAVAEKIGVELGGQLGGWEYLREKIAELEAKHERLRASAA
jgi:chromosome segregation ATPase